MIFRPQGTVCAMAERPKGEDPDFDWLYGTERKGVGSGGTPSHPSDPEPTRVLPTMGRPHQAPPPPRGGTGPDRPAPPRPPSRGVRPAPPPGRPTSGRRSNLRRWVVLLVLAWVAFLVAVPFFAWARIDKVADHPQGGRPAAQPGTTYLLVGSDSRQGLTRKQELDLGTGKGEGRRTDTIMLLHTGSGPNLLMSVPRDSLVDIPGHGRTKINAAFAYGGPRLLIKTLEQDTGIRIDDYVEIGFAGFVNVVDAVGGIQICPKAAMKDKLANLDVKKGCQEVQGKTALAYARSRHVSSLGDIDRARHQREVVSAVGSKAVSPWSVLNPVRYYRLAMAGADSLRVGKHTSLFAAVRFAWAMTHVNGKNGLTCGVPISDLAVDWDPVRSKQLFDLVKQDRTDRIPKSLCTPSGLKNG